MSELNAPQKQKQSSSQLSYAQQQQSEEKHFWRDFINRANEFSKKIAIIDTFAYFVLLIGLLVIMIFRPDLAAYCIQVVPYITTTVVTLRASYSIKAGLENVNKIKASVSTMETEMAINTTKENETQG